MVGSTVALKSSGAHHRAHHHYEYTDLGTGETVEFEGSMETVVVRSSAETQHIPPEVVGSGGTGLGSINGAVFSHLQAGNGYGAFTAASGFLGQEDYDSTNDENINLTSLRFIGEVTTGGDLRFDFYDVTNTTLQASVTAAFSAGGPAVYTVAVADSVSIPDQGVMEITAINGAEANWWGSDATPTTGSESSDFGTLEFAGLSHNFELFNTNTDPDDYGDAPSPYPTLAVDGGALHTRGSLFLGSSVDGEADGSPDSVAMGDDDNGNDEDGVIFNDYFDLGATADVSVLASEAGGVLNAWVDWNQNGSWLDSGEQLFTDQVVSVGTNTLTINVPAGAELGRTFGRFRLSTATGLTPSGSAADGEVEDHAILVEDGGRRLVWTNRGQSNDLFEDTFGGANVNVARGVVDSVIRSWERVLTNLHQPGGRDQIDITVSMDSGGTSFGASANVTNFDSGYPLAGAVTIGRGSDTTGDGKGDGAGFFLDPTPMDWAEFTGGLAGGAFVPYAAIGSPAFGLDDLFTLVNAEITHVMGLFTLPALMNNPLSGSVTDTNIADDSEGGGVGEYFVFDGLSVTHLMTSNNAGSNGQDFGEIVHTAGPDLGSANQPLSFSSAYRGNRQLVGADGPGNALYEGSRRYLVNNVMALLFKDAYGYSVTLPETYGTSYAVFDETTGIVIVRGGESTSEDTISISTDGDDIVVSVDIGNDVAGTGPSGDDSDIGAFVSRFPVSSVTAIEVDGADGNDTLTISPIVDVQIAIDGGSPAFPNGGVGDALSFDIANVSDVGFTDNGDGSGSLTSSSHGTVVWTEIEDVTEPAIAELAISPLDAAKEEGDSGKTQFTFEVARSVNTSGPTKVDWAVAGSGTYPVDAGDFTGGLPSGTVSFGDTESVKTVTVEADGDVDIEPDETFTVTLSNASGVAVVTNGTADGTVQNDDSVNVDTFADIIDSGDGLISLREAIIVANGITFDVDIMLPSGSYSLSVAGSLENLAQTGDLDIESTGTVTLNGPGASIDASALGDRAFHVLSGATLTLNGLEISGGSAGIGGGIVNFGTVVLNNTKLSNNDATTTGGGGLYNETGGVAIISSSIIGSNTSAGSGGGIFNSGDATITNTSFQGNSAKQGGGIRNSGTLTIRDSTVSGNSVSSAEDNHGGGIYNMSGGNLTLLATALSGNSSANFGGGVANDAASTLLVRDSLLAGNDATEDGGGLWNDGAGTVLNSTISGNAANVGAGIIVTNSGSLDLLHSTVSSNTAAGGGGGIFNVGAVDFGHTILAGNAASAGPDGSSIGTQTSLGYNLVGDNTEFSFSAATGDQVGTSSSPIDPRLGPLQDNGGPTFTHRFLVGSPAIDGGDTGFSAAAFTPPLSLDQRGESRIADSDGDTTAVIDIGAFELQSPITPATIQGRHIFYSGSTAFDANGTSIDIDPSGGFDEAAAIAIDKSALLPGQSATYANYTNYVEGINGIMVDIENLPNPLTTNDFTFRIGNDDTPGDWLAAADPTAVVVAIGGGVNSSDRVIVTWENGAIANSWLQVTVKANANTGLSVPDVHYWGNAIAETGNTPGNASVDLQDRIAVRDNPTTFLTPAEIGNVFDFNRDAAVDLNDRNIVKDNASTFLNELELISPPLATETGVVEAILSSITYQQPVDSEMPRALTFDYQPNSSSRELRPYDESLQADPWMGCLKSIPNESVCAHASLPNVKLPEINEAAADQVFRESSICLAL